MGRAEEEEEASWTTAGEVPFGLASRTTPHPAGSGLGGEAQPFLLQGVGEEAGCPWAWRPTRRSHPWQRDLGGGGGFTCVCGGVFGGREGGLLPTGPSSRTVWAGGGLHPVMHQLRVGPEAPGITAGGGGCLAGLPRSAAHVGQEVSSSVPGWLPWGRPFSVHVWRLRSLCFEGSSRWPSCAGLVLAAWPPLSWQGGI